MSINQLLWVLQPHTAAKHVILRKYLSCWMPIMTNSINKNSRVVLWDGFAGPGEYLEGEDGSPIIMLKEAIKYLSIYPKTSADLRFVFVEQDYDRFENLKQKISSLFNGKFIVEQFSNLFLFKLKEHSNIWIYLINQNFVDSSKFLLPNIEKHTSPCFAFIDPFGFKDTPYEVIEKIALNNRTEVFVNFMYEDINRFIKLPSLQTHFNSLFGTEEWKTILENINSYTSAERRYFLHKLYKNQLNKAGFKYVISFEMKNEKNATDYFLYFGTNHILGLEKMKDAMWTVDHSGAYTFSDYDYNQRQLKFVEFDEPDLTILSDILLDHFSGETVTGKVVKDYIITDTIFRKNVHAKKALDILKQRNDIKVTNCKHGYPNHCYISFD